jgi:hypothetical protein
MFLAKTISSGKLKALFEILFSNMSTVILTISKDGIYSEMITTNKSLICVNIPSTCFDEYVFTFSESQHIGLGAHVNTFFKTLKTKTLITLSMNESYTLNVISEDDGCTTSYSAAVISAQNISPAPTYTYESEGIKITCANFNAMCKSFSKTPYLDVVKKNGQLSFSFELTGISTKTLTYGKKNESSEIYFQQHKSDAFVRLNKMASFADEIIVYVEQNKPLAIEATSSLGNLKTFMKIDDY